MTRTSPSPWSVHHSVTTQIELHPNFQQPDQLALHQELCILTQAWSPIGGVYGWAGENAAVPPLRNETILAIAEARGRRPVR